MKYHLMTVLILVLALALYAAGLSAPSLVLVAIGGAAELWFWVRAIRGGRTAKT